jgi:hypothetical protein
MATLSQCACTHLNIPQRKMVFLSSFAIPPDNSGGHPFFYDRGTVEFSVPTGWSFVVTDIILIVVPVSGPLKDPNRYTLAVVAFTNGEERHFTASFAGDNTQHFPLTAGYTIPAGQRPTFRNTTFSSIHAEAHLLGYFARGDALPPGAPAFPLMPETSTPDATPTGDEPVSRS